MKIRDTKSAVFWAIGLCLLTAFSLQIQAQSKSTRVLMCNEKDSVVDTRFFPEDAENINGFVLATWRVFIGDDKGNYRLTVVSNQDFKIEIHRQARTPNSKLVKVGGSAYPTPKYSGTSRSFVHNFFVTRNGSTNTGGEDYIVVAVPKTPYATFRAIWYTSNCGNSSGGGSGIIISGGKPGTGSGAGTGSGTGTGKDADKSCRWIRTDPYGAGMVTSCTCECRGKAASASKCGPKPKDCP